MVGKKSRTLRTWRAGNRKGEGGREGGEQLKPPINDCTGRKTAFVAIVFAAGATHHSRKQRQHCETDAAGSLLEAREGKKRDQQRRALLCGVFVASEHQK